MIVDPLVLSDEKVVISLPGNIGGPLILMEVDQIEVEQYERLYAIKCKNLNGGGL